MSLRSGFASSATFAYALPTSAGSSLQRASSSEYGADGGSARSRTPAQSFSQYWLSRYAAFACTATSALPAAPAPATRAEARSASYSFARASTKL